MTREWSAELRAMIEESDGLALAIRDLREKRFKLDERIAEAKLAFAPIAVGDLVTYRRKIYRVSAVRHSYGEVWDIAGYQRLKSGAFGTSRHPIGGYGWTRLTDEAAS